MEQYLRFIHGNRSYKVNRQGEMICISNEYSMDFSGQWKLLGVSTHHWHRRIIYTVADIFNNPKLMEKGYVWDVDHGTTRIWGGSWYGHLPRVIWAAVFEE
jgi:hypothetical protein